MQLFNKKIFWFFILILSGCRLLEDTLNTEHVPDNTAGELAKQAARLATRASEALDAATDVSAIIDAAEIIVKAKQQMTQAISAKTSESNPFIDQAHQKVKATIGKTQNKLLHFIHKQDDDCENALNMLRKLKPKVPPLCNLRRSDINIDDSYNGKVDPDNLDVKNGKADPDVFLESEKK